MCLYLSGAEPVQSVVGEVRVVGLIRDDVGTLDLVQAVDPGQSRELLIVDDLSIGLRLWDREIKTQVNTGEQRAATASDDKSTLWLIHFTGRSIDN